MQRGHFTVSAVVDADTYDLLGYVAKGLTVNRSRLIKVCLKRALPNLVEEAALRMEGTLTDLPTVTLPVARLPAASMPPA